MTQQFKFGDLVIVDNRSPNPKTGVIVWINNELGEAKVCFEENMRSKYCLIKYFEPVPHPDTVRLEFIAGTYGATLSHARDVLDKEMK